MASDLPIQLSGTYGYLSTTKESLEPLMPKNKWAKISEFRCPRCSKVYYRSISGKSIEDIKGKHCPKPRCPSNLREHLSVRKINTMATGRMFLYHNGVETEWNADDFEFVADS